MRIIALVKSLDHVCCRYRLAAYRPFLQEAGFQLDLCPWPRRWWSRLWLRRELGRADVIVVQRKLPPAWQLSLLRASAPFLLFDFDDAIFIRDSYDTQGPHCPSRAQGFASVVRAAHAVVAGNRFLQEHAALWANPEHIHLVPTCVDPGRYSLAEHARQGDAQLVWIGSSSTLRGMARIQPILERLARRERGLKLKIICDRFLNLRQLPVIRCPWSERVEAAELAAADIGISWIPDDLWSQGKCGLKVLQYMAAGLPVVANPIGQQAQLVRHGETGFLVRTPAQWAEAIGRLAHDPQLRRRMGQNGRALLEANHNVSLGAARWIALLNKFQRADPAPAAAAIPAT